MTAKLGSPFQPLELKCSAIGRPGDGNDYLCLVTKGGTEIYVHLTPGIELMLLHGLREQAAKAS